MRFHRRTSRHGTLLAATAGALLLAAASAQSAGAATIAVTNTSDSGAGSLRQAIADANARAGTDTIDVQVGGTITLASALPSIASDVNIAGPGPDQLTVGRSGGPDFRIFTVGAGTTVTIRGLTATGGSASGSPATGGGIYNQGTLALDHVVVSNNRAGSAGATQGGGIWNSGTLTVTDSTVRDNDSVVNTTATSGMPAALGGGIYNADDVGALIVTRTTVSGNRAFVSAPNGSVPTLDPTASGGAIYNANSLTATNSTISGNTAGTVTANNVPRAGGAGIASTTTGWSVVLRGVTLAFNTAPSGANLNYANTGTITIRNTLLSNPSGSANCRSVPGPTFTDDGYNLASDSSCGLTQPTDQSAVDPQLQPLADNGGPTQTHALPRTSPAVDRGSSTGLATDQRGFARPFDVPTASNDSGDGSDIGAFERQENPVATDDSRTVGEDSGETAMDVLANDTDPLGGTIEITGVTDPAHGTARVIQGAPDRIGYTPDSDYCNDAPAVPDSFGYTISGGATATVSVRVTCVDDPPTAANDEMTVVEDSGPTPVDVLANDSDKEGDPIQVIAVSDPSHGSTEIVEGAPDRITYKPDPGYCNNPPGDRPGTFRYTVNGGATATVMVTVNCVEDSQPPPDTTTPGVVVPAPKLSLSPTRVRVSRKLVPVRLACRGTAGTRCHGVLELLPRGHGARKLRKRFSIGAGAKATVRFRPTAAMRATLARKRKLTARATARLEGTASPVVKRLTILAERRR